MFIVNDFVIRISNKVKVIVSINVIDLVSNSGTPLSYWSYFSNEEAS